jgi:hypothetical protein
MRVAPALVALLAATCGCASGGSGGSGGGGPAQPAAAAAATSIPLGEPPEAVGQLCGIVATGKQGVLCPTRFPHKPGSESSDSKPLARDDYPGYLIEWHVTKFRGSDLGHVVVGGQPKPFSFARSIRRDGELGMPGRLKVLRRGVAIGRARGVVVQSPPHPAGGINGGHVSVLWNQDGRGYLVSLHFAGYPLRDRIAAAIGMARSSSPPQPGGGCDPGSDCG